MDKTNYVLSEELISAEEARIKAVASKTDLLVFIKKLDRAIRDKIATGGMELSIRCPSPEIINILKERGYSVVQPYGPDGPDRLTFYNVSW